MNKKSELTLMRRATVYSSSCLQVVKFWFISIFFVAVHSWSRKLEREKITETPSLESL